MAELHNDPTFDQLLEEQIDKIGGCAVCIHRVIVPYHRDVAVGCKNQITYPECRAVKAGFLLDEDV